MEWSAKRPKRASIAMSSSPSPCPPFCVCSMAGREKSRPSRGKGRWGPMRRSDSKNLLVKTEGPVFPRRFCRVSVSGLSRTDAAKPSARRVPWPAIPHRALAIHIIKIIRCDALGGAIYSLGRLVLSESFFFGLPSES